MIAKGAFPSKMRRTVHAWYVKRNVQRAWNLR